MEFSSLRQFYGYYLTQHSNPVCRTLHFIGSSLVLLTLGFAIATANAWWLIALPVIGYGFAWVGHYRFEKNRPATFGHPFYALACDWVMWWDMLTGKVPFSGHLAP